jgi:ribonuclease Z
MFTKKISLCRLSLRVSSYGFFSKKISFGFGGLSKKRFMASLSTKTKVVAQVVGIDTGDSSPAIIVTTDTSRYLFDAGEGLQRFCGEHRTRLVKVDAMFLSQISAMRAGGLPGLLLTLADMGKTGVTVYGPRGLHDFAFALRHFLRRDDFSLHANELYSCHKDRSTIGPRAIKMPTINRSDLIVTPILLMTDRSKSDVDDAINKQVRKLPPGLGRRPFEDSLTPKLTQPSIHNNEKNGAKSLVTLSGPFQPLTLETIGCKDTNHLPLPLEHLSSSEDAKFEEDNDSQVIDTAICYICSTFPVSGRFHPERAKALGIPVGPLFGDLMRGQTIQLANGVSVTPPEVKEPDSPGQMFAIMCCPTVKFLPSLINSADAFSDFFEKNGETINSKFLVVFHQTPAVVASMPEYVEWMRHCGPKTKHIMLDHISKSRDLPTMFFDQAVQQCKLNILRPGTFALPQPIPTLARQLAVKVGYDSTLFHSSLSDLQYLAKINLESISSSPSVITNESLKSSTIEKGQTYSIEPFETEIVGVRVINSPPLLTFNIVPLATQGLQLTCQPQSVNSNSSKSFLAKTFVKPTLPWLGIVRPDLAIQSMIEDPAMKSHLQTALCTIKQLDQGISPLRNSLSVPDDAEIIFTGTSSAVPNKYRNVSGIYVRMPPPATSSSVSERNAIFLDCGEGSYGSLVRRLGREVSQFTSKDNGGLRCVDDAVACISLVWISHMHADHHLGTLRLIVERAIARKRCDLPSIPVLVVGPSRMYFWLLEMSRIDRNLAGQWRFADAEYFTCIPSLGSPVESDSINPDLSFASLETGKRARSTSQDKSVSSLHSAGFAQCLMDEEKIGEGRSISEYSTTTYQVDTREAPRSSRRPATHLVQLPVENSTTKFENGHHLAERSFCESIAAGLGLTALRAVRVRHCHKAYGIRLEVVSKSCKENLESSSQSPHFHSWSLVYSGDTRPCSELVALGLGGNNITDLVQHASAGIAPTFTKFNAVNPDQQNTLAAAAEAASSGCSLLIHEATFEDDEDGCANAIAKRHSTAGQACEIALEMGAQHTILTHFSARYPKLPVLKVSGVVGSSQTLIKGDPVADSAAAVAAASQIAGRTLFVAYDLMRITGRDLYKLPSLLPALHTLFAEDETVVDDEL